MSKVKLSDLRVTVHATFTVNADGTEGELVHQTEPRFSNVATNVAYSSAEEALLAVNTPEDVEEGEIVEEAIA